MFHQSDKSAYIDTHWEKTRIYRLERPPNRDYISEKGGLNDHLIYKFKLKMANTLSVMTNVLRNVVSKKRIRYKGNGFDLDLAYICDNIIAMGYPADNLESIYRNRLEDVYKFLEEHHEDRYKIYNLCLERSYDKNKFHGRVAVYPFEDHNPPTIELIQKFCNDVDTWLRADSKNVAAVHCKAGKGRTGTMICCYLLYCGLFLTPEDALAYYDSKRTKDGKGVTIPSQRRYVQYFSKLLQTRKPYEKCTLQFCEIRFTEANFLHNQGSVHCSVSVLQDTLDAVKVETLQNLCTDFRKSYTVDLRSCNLDVTGDIKIELNSKSSKKKIFHFWFNTYFIDGEADTEGEGDDAKYIYTLNKCEIDDVHKDKEHKCYPENFKVHLVFYKNAARIKNQQAFNTAAVNKTNASNHELTLIKMGGRNNANHNSYSLTTAANSIVAPMELSTQLNNSGSNLSYNCDQRSSSSSASVSSVMGGSGSGNDSTKFYGNLFGTENRLKINNHGNMDLKPHPLLLPPSNFNRNVGIGVFDEELGTDTLVQSALSDCNALSTANNVSIKTKLLRQHHDNQQQQDTQQYQLSESSTPTVLPSKLSRGSNNINIQSKVNHVGYESFVGGVEFGNDASGSDINNLPTNNGIGGNDHHIYDLDVDRDAIDDDDAEEDWESVNTSSATKIMTNFEASNATTSAENGSIIGSVENSTATHMKNNNNVATKNPTNSVHSVVCDAANYVLLSSSKSHPYKKRAPHNIGNRLEECNVTTAPPMGHCSNVIPNGSFTSAHAHAAMLAKNLKPRPRRETT